jgi:hypothetical protein
MEGTNPLVAVTFKVSLANRCYSNDTIIHIYNSVDNVSCLWEISLQPPFMQWELVSKAEVEQ